MSVLEFFIFLPIMCIPLVLIVGWLAIEIIEARKR